MSAPLSDLTSPSTSPSPSTSTSTSTSISSSMMDDKGAETLHLKRKESSSHPTDITTSIDPPSKRLRHDMIHSTTVQAAHQAYHHPSLTKIIAVECSEKGKKQYQQDRAVIIAPLLTQQQQLQQQPGQEQRYCLYAIYDGHGGEITSQYLADHLHENVATHIIQSQLTQTTTTQISAQPTRVRAAIIEALNKTESDVLTHLDSKKSEQDGAVACIVVVEGQLVWIANVGDARAVLGRYPSATDKSSIKTIRLTKEHTPLLLEERKRIQKAGGVIEDGRVGGQLGVSRSFGDIRFKRVGCIATPEISKFTLSSLDAFMIVACDGLWSIFSPDAATEFVHTHLQAGFAAIAENRTPTTALKASQAKETPEETLCRKVVQKLVREACLVRSAKDNVTAILILFMHPTTSSSSSSSQPSVIVTTSSSLSPTPSLSPSSSSPAAMSPSSTSSSSTLTSTSIAPSPSPSPSAFPFPSPSPSPSTSTSISSFPSPSPASLSDISPVSISTPSGHS